jgi:hypothetical protein
MGEWVRDAGLRVSSEKSSLGELGSNIDVVGLNVRPEGRTLQLKSGLERGKRLREFILSRLLGITGVKTKSGLRESAHCARWPGTMRKRGRYEEHRVGLAAYGCNDAWAGGTRSQRGLPRFSSLG